MSRNRPISIAVGPGGWVEARWQPRPAPGATDAPHLAAYIRFATVDDERAASLLVARERRALYRAVELRLLEPSQEAMRTLPLAKVEQAANANGLVATGLAIGITRDPPDDVAAFFQHSRKQLGPRVELRRPPGRRLPDSFYAHVADAYRSAVDHGLNPRATLAADAGVPLDTVARWIGRARKREHLEETTGGQPVKRP